MTGSLDIRPATEDEIPAMLELLRDSMERKEDSRFGELFRWKHVDNAFGPSPMWVACEAGRIVALRTFMRWEFERGEDRVRCVRAVDTATHPDVQGRGLFRELTLGALPWLENDGIDFIFNTPNDRSRPGYLKMGWHVLGKARARVRPCSPRGVLALARSRVPAAHWSEPATFGVDGAHALADDGEVAAFVRSLPPGDRWRTRWTPDVLRWRFGSSLPDYRAVTGGSLADGVVFARVRRRGDARELVVASVFTPEGGDSARALVRRLIRAARNDVDYAVGVGALPTFVPAGTGPVVTARPVRRDAPASISAFEFTMGDIELF